MDFQVRFHHVVNIHRLHAARTRHAQGVAKKGHGVMRLKEIRVFTENGALLRVVHLFLDFGGARLAGVVV